MGKTQAIIHEFLAGTHKRHSFIWKAMNRWRFGEEREKIMHTHTHGSKNNDMTWLRLYRDLCDKASIVKTIKCRNIFFSYNNYVLCGWQYVNNYAHDCLSHMTCFYHDGLILYVFLINFWILVCAFKNGLSLSLGE